MKTSARLTFDKLAFNKDNDLHLVVSLTAPKLDWEKKRQPILIVPVIDISGSMNGSKLDYAKQSVSKLIDHLQPGDFVGLVVFDSEAELISAPVEITQSKKDELKNKVAKLYTKNSTAFADGMLLALEQVNKTKLPEDVLIRVIMFTDGHANVGPKGAGILKILEKKIGKASVSAFGYGPDADQEFLADFSVKAKGNYAFIKNPDDAPAAFAKELGGLLSTYAQDIVISVKPQNNVKLDSVVTDIPSSKDNDSTFIKVSEILSEEVRNLVFSLKALKLSQTDQLISPIETQICNVKVSYKTFGQDGNRVTNDVELPVSVTFVNPGDEQTKATTDVDASVALAQMVKAQIEAEKLAQAGNYDMAYSSMNAVSDSFSARGHKGISVTSSNIGKRLRTSSEFLSSSGYRNTTKSASTRSVGVSSYDADALTDMTQISEEIGISLSNTAQDSMVESFTKEAPAEPQVENKTDSK